MPAGSPVPPQTDRRARQAMEHARQVFGVIDLTARSDAASAARAALSWLFERFPELNGAMHPQHAELVADHFSRQASNAYYKKWGELLRRCGVLERER